MINLLKTEIVNGISVVLFEIDAKRYGATYFADKVAFDEIRFRDYKRWTHYKGQPTVPAWVGRPETKLQAENRFNQMVEALKNNQVKIKTN